MLLTNFNRFEIILIIIIIILVCHCVYRETYFSKFCNIRCICKKIFNKNDGNEGNKTRHNNIIHLELSDSNKINI